MSTMDGKAGAQGRIRTCFVVESGTDARLVEGLAERFDLSIIAREIRGGVEISQRLERAASVVVGSGSRLGFTRQVWKLLRDRVGQLDYVIVQGYGAAALAANIVSLSAGVPCGMLVCSPAELYYECRRSNLFPSKVFRRRELLTLKALAKANARVGSRYFVLSRHLEEVVRRHGSVKRVDIVPVYGVDTGTFVPSREDKSLLKARSGLPTEGKLIFFGSRIAPEKDAPTLLKACALLRSRGKNLWLLHRSGGFREFVREAERFGVGSRVIATDAVDPRRDLARDYQASDVCVQASREEGLGFSVLEAMACAVPVVAAAVGGLKETVLDGCTGWTYPVGDAEALSSRIEEAISNPCEAARRAQAGRELVCRRYERQLVFDRLEALVKADTRG
jgi:glycosyltransferase involved in cell wall biosynthesis